MHIKKMVNKMVREEPIEPNRPEQSKEAKFTLTKVMACAITAITKDKEVFIETAEIGGDEEMIMTIKCVIPKDAKIWEEYRKEKSTYLKNKSAWTIEKDCELYNITPEQREIAEQKYYEARKNENYKYPESKSKADFFKEIATEPSPIIEVA